MLPIQTTALHSIAPSSQTAQAQDDTPRENGSFEDAVTAERLADQEQDADTAQEEAQDQDKVIEVEEEVRLEDKEPLEHQSRNSELEIEESLPQIKAPEPDTKVAVDLQKPIPLAEGLRQKSVAQSDMKEVFSIKPEPSAKDAVPAKADTQLVLNGARIEQPGQVKVLQDGDVRHVSALANVSLGKLERPDSSDVTPSKPFPTQQIPQTSNHVAAVVSPAGITKVAAPAATIPDSKSLDGFDVEIRTLTAAEPIAPKTPTHPLQSILHAQLPQQTQKVAHTETLEFSPDIKAIRTDAAHVEVGEVRVTTPFGATIAPRADLQAAIPRQLTEAVRVAQASDKMIEVALSPAELGRVRMTMSPAEAGLTISITAERPETLDLLRRHIQDLQQSFEDMGYEDISFAFGQEQADSRDGFAQDDKAEKTAQSSVGAPMELDTSTPALQQLAHVSSGIDIRV